MSYEKSISLLDLSKEEFAFIGAAGYPKFREEQVFIASRQYKSYDEMSNIPKNLRNFLQEKYIDLPVKIIETYTGKDGTEKYLFLMRDGNIVEGVFMPHKYGNTLCISTQVGCRMGCKFCASTLNGLVRNLTAGEMLGEVLSVNKKHTLCNIASIQSSREVSGVIPKNLRSFLIVGNNASESIKLNTRAACSLILSIPLGVALICKIILFSVFCFYY